jgi:hypothetical protein
MVRQADRSCLDHLLVLLGTVMPDWLHRFKTPQGFNSRHRVFTPVLTFWAFLAQVLDADGSCRRALTRVQVLLNHACLETLSEDTGAYCRARARLPIRLLVRILRHLNDLLGRLALPSCAGGRLLVMDGTTLNLPDTPQNAASYWKAPGQKPGCGFPLMHVLGLFDLRTGAWIAAVKSNGRRHEASLAWRLLKHLRKGDTLVADRAFCSYAFISALQQHGVDAVMRLHQRRDSSLRQGKRLGKGDRLQSWVKPLQASKTLSRARWQSLPDAMNLRLVHVAAEHKGFRTQELILVTTLTDAQAYSVEQIADFYRRRWQVELFFDDIKTSMRMETLRCKTPHMLARELLMHMIAYNMMRHLMLRADALRPVAAGGILSFKGAVDRVQQWQWPLWSAKAKQANQHCEALLRSIAADPVPIRPRRSEPRCVKRRPKSYQWLTCPRSQMRELPHRHKHYYYPKSKPA